MVFERTRGQRSGIEGQRPQDNVFAQSDGGFVLQVGDDHIIVSARSAGVGPPVRRRAPVSTVAKFAVADVEAFGLRVRQSEDGKSAITMRYAKGSLNVAGTEVALALAPESRTLTLRAFVDKSVLAVFINDGETSVTRVEYPGEDDLGVSVFAENGSVTLTSLDAWELKPIW